MGWLLLLAIAVCLWLAFRLRRRGARAAEALAARGLPAGARTVWQDLTPDSRWAGGRSLADPATKLRGRIDHAFRTRDGRLVLAEIKACAQPPDKPHESDTLQLGAYFLLCERDPRVREAPSYGLLAYHPATGQPRVFSLANTPALRGRVTQTLDALRAAEAAETAHRSHHRPGRCRGCGWAGQCDEAL